MAVAHRPPTLLNLALDVALSPPQKEFLEGFGFNCLSRISLVFYKNVSGWSVRALRMACIQHGIKDVKTSINTVPSYSPQLYHLTFGRITILKSLDLYAPSQPDVAVWITALTIWKLSYWHSDPLSLWGKSLCPPYRRGQA